MRSALDNLAFFKHHDGIGVTNGGKSMRNHEGGSILHKAIHSLFDVTLGSRINRRGSFIQNEDRRFGKCRTRNIQKLTLTL